MKSCWMFAISDGDNMPHSVLDLKTPGLRIILFRKDIFGLWDSSSFSPPLQRFSLPHLTQSSQICMWCLRHILSPIQVEFASCYTQSNHPKGLSGSLVCASVSFFHQGTLEEVKLKSSYVWGYYHFFHTNAIQRGNSWFMLQIHSTLGSMQLTAAHSQLMYLTNKWKISPLMQ